MEVKKEKLSKVLQSIQSKGVTPQTSSDSELDQLTNGMKKRRKRKKKMQDDPVTVPSNVNSSY